MTTELVLLLSLFAFIFMGALVNGPKQSYLQSGPRLGARVEHQLVTGYGFVPQTSDRVAWEAAPR